MPYLRQTCCQFVIYIFQYFRNHMKKPYKISAGKVLSQGFKFLTQGFSKDSSYVSWDS